MKLIIAGSRSFSSAYSVIDLAFDYIPALRETLPEYFSFKEEMEIKEVVSGCAKGIDTAGEQWAKAREIKVKKFPADWDKHGKAAGPIRNKEMAEYGDILLLIWDGKSPGSANMKKNMLELGKPVYEVIFKVSNENDSANT